MLHNPVVPSGASPKFHKPWVGPYRITNVQSYPSVEITQVNNPDTKMRVHANRLKPFYELFAEPDPIELSTQIKDQKPQLKKGHPYSLRSCSKVKARIIH